MVLELESPSIVCPECSGYLIEVHKVGETVCNQCDLVINEREIDTAHCGVRAYSNQEKERKWHNGNPISSLVADISLSTIIERSKIFNEDLKRAARWDMQISWERRNLLIAIMELKRIACHLRIPHYIQKAVVKLYKKAFKRGLLRGRSIKGILIASLYYVIKKETLPITMQELINESCVSPRVLNKCFKVLINELNLKPNILNPVLLIPKYINRLKLGPEIEKQSIKIIKNYMKNKGFSGKDPKGLCAGTIYFISKLKNNGLTQKEISAVTGVTEVTLRSRHKDLLRFINFVPQRIRYSLKPEDVYKNIETSQNV